MFAVDLATRPVQTQFKSVGFGSIWCPCIIIIMIIIPGARVRSPSVGARCLCTRQKKKKNPRRDNCALERLHMDPALPFFPGWMTVHAPSLSLWECCNRSLWMLFLNSHSNKDGGRDRQTEGRMIIRSCNFTQFLHISVSTSFCFRTGARMTERAHAERETGNIHIIHQSHLTDCGLFLE